MELNGQDDYVARLIQAVCAVPLSLIGFFCVSMLPSIFGILLFVKWTVGFGSFYLAYRCLRYAITGQKNINRDELS